MVGKDNDKQRKYQQVNIDEFKKPFLLEKNKLYQRNDYKKKNEYGSHANGYMTFL